MENTVMKRATMTMVVLLLAVSSLQAADKKKKDGWISMFDGKSFKGWKASENKDTWQIKDGCLTCAGPRSHLFYMGSDKPFKNFEFEADVMTKKNSNSGIYIHTRFQKSGWPKHGYEVQVNTTHGDSIKTGSLYGVVKVTADQLPVKDDEWFKIRIRVEGRHVVTKVNDKVLVDFTEKKERKAGKDFTRILSKGTIALQAHDPGSVVLYKNLKIRHLP